MIPALPVHRISGTATVLPPAPVPDGQATAKEHDATGADECRHKREAGGVAGTGAEADHGAVFR
jgi:hypothetical protein